MAVALLGLILLTGCSSGSDSAPGTVTHNSDGSVTVHSKYDDCKITEKTFNCK